MSGSESNPWLARTAAIVLAAGRGKRMGRPKALLERPDGGTFLSGLLSAYASVGVSQLIAVIGAEASAVRQQGRAHLSEHVDPIWVLSDPDSPMIDSIRAGVANVDPVMIGAFIHPVDQPILPPELPGAMVEACMGAPGCAVLPTWERRPGHPVFLPRPLFERLTDPQVQQGGLRRLFEARGSHVQLETTRKEILLDLDRPEDLKQLQVLLV